MFPLNLPNTLTVIRILLVPVVVVALLDETPNGDAIAAGVFALAAFTDGLDGYIARSRDAVTTFGKDQGMREANCTASFNPNMQLHDDGSVWVATLGGVSAFVPAASAPRAMVVPVVDEIAVDGVPVTVAPEVRVRAGQADLAIHYTAPTFLGPGPPRLAHRLRGHDADWVLVPPQMVAHYQHLPAGEYALELYTEVKTVYVNLEK